MTDYNDTITPNIKPHLKMPSPMQKVDSHQNMNSLPIPRVIRSALHHIGVGSLKITFPNGHSEIFKGHVEGPNAALNVRNQNIFLRVIKNGEIGFAEAYMDGDWDTPDLLELLDLMVANTDSLRKQIRSNVFFKSLEKIRHWFNSNTKRQAKKNISYHYDLGNDFYKLWLDESMTYSAGIFSNPDDTLAKSQHQKYASVCDRTNIKPDDSILEIGCGWGGFAEFAAKERGAKITALTISQEQHDFAKKRMFEAGLNERVQIVLRDYRDETGLYDGIASIEMFEAVGEKHWPDYFGTVHQRLKPNALATIQTITIRDDLYHTYRSKVDFIQKYIFPGGMLPSLSIFKEQSQTANLIVRDTMTFGQGYSETLRLWFKRFNAEWPQIQDMGFDDRFRRMWNFYLAACAANFRYGTTDVAQVTLAR